MTVRPALEHGAFEHAVGLLERLCAVSSATGDVAGIRCCGEILARELGDLGFEAGIDDWPDAAGESQPVFVARSRQSGRGHVLLIGHLDTVLPAVSPRRAGDRLEGTGALDMKGGFATLTGALHLRRSRGEALPGDLVVVGVPDEEIGGPVSEAVVRKWGDGAGTVAVLEPGRAVPGGETIVTGRRGLSVWRLIAVGEAAHSGLAFSEGRSALAAAAEWAAGVQGPSEATGGATVNVGRIVGGDSEFVRDLGEEHRFVGTSQRLNVVADRCLAEGEARYLSLADRDRTLETMRALAAATAGRWEVAMDLEVVEEIPPLTPSAVGVDLAARLVEAAASDGWRLELEGDRGGVSFPNFLPDPEAVPVLDGLGPVGEGMHTRNEFVSLVSMSRRISLLDHLLGVLTE